MSVYMQPTSVIKTQLGIQPGGRICKYAVHRCRVRMNNYVPSGGSRFGLRQNVSETSDAVIYKSPYAHYIYEGILYVDPETGSSWARKDVIKVPTSKMLKYHTPGTGRHWDKLMLSAEKQELIDDIQRQIRR